MTAPPARALLTVWTREQRYCTWCALLILAAFLALALLISPETPTNPAPHGAGQSAQGNVEPFSPEERLARYTLWLERFTGLLAFVSAIQICFLIRADLTARRSADAAHDAAEALPKIERAYVFLDSEKMAKTNTELSGTIGDGTVFEVFFKNHGKTPAIIRSLNMRCIYSPNAYPVLAPETNATVAVGLVIASGDSTDGIACVVRATDDQIAEARDGAGYVLLIGQFGYLDVLRESCDTYFCWEFNFDRGRFVLFPSEELNRYT